MNLGRAPDWSGFWDAKAASGNDFQATGRGLMDVVGFLHTVNEVGRLLDPGRDDVLVDVGCGTGLIALAMAPWVGSVRAIDLSPKMVERATANLAGVANVVVSRGSITQTGLPDRCCERLLAYSVLQYLGSEAELGQALQEAGRLLRPGGRALFAANPDPARRAVLEEVIRGRADQDTTAAEIALQKTLQWIAPERLCEVAAGAGLRARHEAISERIWQHFYMFDLVVEKPL